MSSTKTTYRFDFIGRKVSIISFRFAWHHLWPWSDTSLMTSRAVVCNWCPYVLLSDRIRRNVKHKKQDLLHIMSTSRRFILKMVNNKHQRKIKKQQWTSNRCCSKAKTIWRTSLRRNIKVWRTTTRCYFKANTSYRKTWK